KTKFEAGKKYKVRLLVKKWGSVKIEFDEINFEIKSAKIILSKIERCDVEKFKYHKTTFRPWDDELKKAKLNGFGEVLFINENDELLEGAISNLVIEKNGRRFTPPIELGILNGCYRKYLLDNKLCSEKRLTLTDLKNADKIIFCNSVRKEILVDEIIEKI
ncbi:MAG: aminotransferase class IV, partial [Ignavibacteriae bacterium]|nr:aminotransferase class IV [Ignavibacteriota bacterium]